MIPKLPHPELITQRRSIKQYDMQPLDAKRLDRLFKIELNDIGKFAKDESKSHNPKDVMQKVLNSEVVGRKFRFKGLEMNEQIQIGT
jgi:hypothetical protein